MDGQALQVTPSASRSARPAADQFVATDGLTCRELGPSGRRSRPTYCIARHESLIAVLRHHALAIFYLAALPFGLTGCVERRMTIRTNVDDQGGALAIVDDQEVGYTPV